MKETKKYFFICLISFLTVILNGTILLVNFFLPQLLQVDGQIIIISNALFLPLFLFLFKLLSCKVIKIKPITFFSITTITSVVQLMAMWLILTVLKQFGFLIFASVLILEWSLIFIALTIVFIIKMFKKSVKHGFITVGVILLSIIIINLLTFWHTTNHPTHFLYNDNFVIGNTKESIIKRYGKPTTESKNKIHYIVDYLIDPEYYCIKFNEKGIAYEVDLHLMDCE